MDKCVNLTVTLRSLDQSRNGRWDVEVGRWRFVRRGHSLVRGRVPLEGTFETLNKIRYVDFLLFLYKVKFFLGIREKRVKGEGKGRPLKSLET